MSQPDNSDPHQIDNLEHKLYDPRIKDGEITLHHIHDDGGKELPTDWGTEYQPEIIATVMPTQHGFSFGTKMLFIAGVIMFLTLSFTAWRVLSSRNVVSGGNIDLSIDGKPYVEGGEATPFTVAILNRNTVSLQDVVLTVSYEKGVGVQAEQQKVYEKRSIGTLASNSLRQEDVDITVYGKEADSRVISVKLEYKVAGANAVFNKTITTSVVLKTPPLSVHVDGPAMLVQGQVGTFKISVKNNTTNQIDGSLVSVSLPTIFALVNSTPKPVTKGLVWNLPSLYPGATTTITLTGSFTGQPGESDTIKASVGGGSGSVNEIGVVYAEDERSVVITAPLLALSTKLETDRGATENLRYGDKAILLISYANRSKVVLQNVSIVAHIEGLAPLYSQIVPDGGYYDSLKQTITFDSSTNSELISIAPGAEGVFRLQVPVVTRGNNSPTLTVTTHGSASVASKDDTQTEVSKTWTVQGSATISAWTAYNVTTFANTGPLPPQANNNTTYAVHLVASAQNGLLLARVSFVLPAYVTWTGNYTPNTQVSYDTRTRTVIWNIGGINAGSIVSNDIQVSVRPSQSHVGQLPPITSGITLEADETDSRAHIRTAIGALTTELTREVHANDVSHVVPGQ